MCSKSSERLIENINENWWYLNSSVSWLVCHWSKWWDQYCLLTDSVIILTSTANFRIGRRLEHASTNSLWIMQNNKFTLYSQLLSSRYVGFLHFKKKKGFILGSEISFGLGCPTLKPTSGVHLQSKVWPTVRLALGFSIHPMLGLLHKML